MKREVQMRKYVMGICDLMLGAILTILAISLGVSVKKGLWPHIVFLIGTSIFFDAVHYIATGQSLMHELWSKKKSFFTFVAEGFTIEAILDFFGIFLFLTWTYPTFERQHGFLLYLIFAPLGLLFLYESYTACLVLLRKGLRLKEKYDITKKQKGQYGNIIGSIGIILFIFSFLLLYYSSLNPWYVHYIIGFGCFGILEYIAWRREQETFLTHIMRLDMVPLVLVFFLSFTLGYGWEAMNAQMGSWVYTNLPAHASILTGGVPLIAVLQWPFLYILFLSFYSAVFRPRKAPCFW